MRGVSVIVPCSHDGAVSERLIEALEHQERRDVPVELVIVINSTKSAAPPYLDGRVRVVWQPHPGAAAARNAGVTESTGDVLAFVDSDCTPDPTWLAQGLKRLESRPDAIIAGQIVRRLEPLNFNWVSRYDTITYLQQESYVKFSRACVTANIITGRETFNRVGPFDERFTEAACEDWEWSTRATRKGIELLYDPEMVVVHPHLHTFGQLRRKAERIGRGEAILHGINGSSPAGLVSSMYRQMRRVWRDQRTPMTNKVPLLFIAGATATWQWRARSAGGAARTTRGIAD